MMKKSLRAKMAAAVLTGAMAVSMMGTTVFAAGVGTTSLPVTKNIQTNDDGTMEPNVTFKFSVTPFETNSSYTDNGKTYVVYPGKAGGLKGTEITFKAGESAAATYTNSSTLETDASVFTESGPGIYAYTVTEDALPTDDKAYEGITKDDTTYTVYVFVENGDEGYTVSNVVAVKGEAKVKSDIVFTNDYGKDNNTTHDVTIKKTVTGNQGDKNKKFDFTYKVDGADGEKYTALVGNETKAIISGQSYTAQLKDSETIVIKGLSNTDQYTVEEADYTADGYTTKIDEAAVRTKTAAVTADGTEVNVVNDKSVNTPTGIVLTYAPYALMAALAAAFAFLFLRRRNREEI